MMNRRLFLVGSAALAACADNRLNSTSKVSQKRMAITMDDFHLEFDIGLSQEKRHANILEAFDAVGHKAAGFVTGSFVDNPWGREVVQDWLDRGHVIANHTWTHPRASETETALYLSDIEKNRDLLSSIPGTADFFRFPFLQDGKDHSQQVELFEGLKALGLQNGPVTISSVDWYTTSRLEDALKAEPSRDISAYRDYYVGMCLQLAEYWNEVALALGYTSLPHLMLLHHNVLNGHFLKDVLLALKSRGWTFVDAQEALEFEPYHSIPSEPTNGRNWLTLKAIENGVVKKPYPKKYLNFGRNEMDALGL